MADSMRVGKTTAVKVIGEGLRARGKKVKESYEDWQSNPYLKGSYTDSEKNFLESQKWFAKRKWEQVQKVDEEMIIIQDVTPEMDYNYALTNMKLGRMSRQSFREYESFFNKLDWKGVPKPNLIVYLAVSDEKLIERAMESKREFEKVDEDYFLMMKKVNRRWLKKAKERVNILVVNTDKLDFANDKKAKEELVLLVTKKSKLGR
ncbi:MAG: deoxynucleoside kinase [bacterium]